MSQKQCWYGCGRVRNKEQETEPGWNEALVPLRLKPADFFRAGGFEFLVVEATVRAMTVDCPWALLGVKAGRFEAKLTMPTGWK